MDRREAMPMSGSAPFYMQRGMSELHGQQQQQQQQQEDGRSFSHSGMPFQQNVVGGNSGHGFVRDPHQNVMSDGLGVGVAAAAVVQPSPTPMRRKRGRPRKYGPDGKVSLALSSMSVAPRIVNATAEKRGRGRPPGSGRKQQLAPFGRLVFSSAGVGFTPHVITVATGEDISAKLLAFAQQGPRAVCILSANGAVSTVTLRQPSTSGGSITYEGRFDILCMSGSFLLMGTDTSCDRSGGLNISLAGPDGRLIGGCVGGMLIAASPVQVVVGSFIWTSSKINHKMQVGAEGGGDSQHYSVDSVAQNHHFNPTTSMGGWATPQTLDMRNSHVDIDLMRE